MGASVKRFVTFAEAFGFGVLALAVAGALAVGWRFKEFNYDEMLRAHSVWLTSRGLHPYRGFFECHPPYFPLLTWAVRWADEPRAYLSVLRAVGLAGNLMFLAGLLTLGLATARVRRWAVLGLAAVAVAPGVLDSLVEFRMDGWGYALAVWGLVLFRRRADGAYRAFEFGLVSAVATLVLCPKLTLFPALTFLCELLRPGATWRGALGRFTAFAAGAAVAGVAVAAYLHLEGMGVREAFDGVYRYNAAINAHSGFGYGMAREVGRLWWLSAPVALGVAVWVAGLLSRRERPDPYLAAVALWLAAQPLLVASPYKQYFGPWFLFAGVFLGRPGEALERVSNRLGSAAFWACVVATSALAVVSASKLADPAPTARMFRTIDWVRRAIPPGDPVVVDPQLHPLDRPDTFYFWFNTYDPGGFDGEHAVGTIPALQAKVSEAHYRAELKARPPALVLVSMPRFPVLYPDRQARLLGTFLQEEGYHVVSVGGARFALRPEAYRRAGRLGLLPGFPRPAASHAAPFGG